VRDDPAPGLTYGSATTRPTDHQTFDAVHHRGVIRRTGEPQDKWTVDRPDRQPGCGSFASATTFRTRRRTVDAHAERNLAFPGVWVHGKDVAPRRRRRDVFGNGKTAIKASINK
jgi:hypothetical protein